MSQRVSVGSKVNPSIGGAVAKASLNRANELSALDPKRGELGHRSAPSGDRLGRLLLDRTSPLFASHGDLLYPIRTLGRLRDQAL